jgi:hypothetical protein
MPDDLEKRKEEFQKALSDKDIEFMVSMAQDEEPADEEEGPKSAA